MNNPWSQFYSPFFDQFSPYSYLPVYAPPPIFFGNEGQHFSPSWVPSPREGQQMPGEICSQNDNKMLTNTKRR